MKISVKIFLLFGLLALASTSAYAAPPIKVAALYNLTGSQASIDKPALQGVKLKAKQINQNGGLLDGRKIKIIATDTKSKQKAAASAARHAVGIDHLVAGIGYGDTTYVLAAGPQFQKAGIPFLTTGATLPTLPKMVGDDLFLVPFGDNVQAWAMANYAYNKLGLRNIAVWTDKSMDYATALSQFFRTRFKKLGGKISLQGKFTTKERDFSAQVTRLKSKADNLDGIYIASGPNTAGIIVKQIREAGIDMPIMGGDGLDTPLLTQVPGKKLATNVYYSTHALIGEKAKKFSAAFKKEYGHEPPNTFAALGYDGIGLLADAIKRAGSTDHSAVLKALSSTSDYQAVTGKISYAGGSNVPIKPVAIMQVKHGKVSRITTVTPSTD